MNYGMEASTIIQQVRGKTVAQGMGGIIFSAEPYFGDIGLHKMLDAAFVHG